MCDNTEITVPTTKEHEKLTRFQLFHHPTSENVAVVVLDEELIRDENFIDPETGTFSKIKHGTQFTLIPMESPTVEILTRVKEIHEKITKAPCHLPSMMWQRMDEFVSVVGLMFGETEAVLVESIDDIARLITPQFDSKAKPPTIVKRTVMGGLLDEVNARFAEKKLAKKEAEGAEEAEEAVEAAEIIAKIKEDEPEIIES